MMEDDFEVKAGGGDPMDVGAHVAKFLGVKKVTSDKYEGERRRWEFEITAGQFAGRLITALTDLVPSTVNHCGVIIAGLIGRPLATKDRPAQLVNEAVGKVYLVGYRVGSKGGKPAVRSVDAVPPGM